MLEAQPIATSPAGPLIVRKHTNRTFERIEEVRRLEYGFLTGGAGRGKTELIKEIIGSDPSWGRLCATTGVAAINLGTNTPTIHALLHCARMPAFRRAFEDKQMHKCLANLQKAGYRRIVIDEASMLLAEQFSYIYRACLEVGMGLILIGDFLQLPPVPPEPEERLQPYDPNTNWCFLSKYWPEFTDGKGLTDGRGIIQLKINHRQASPDFNDLLDYLRAGNGHAAQAMAVKAGCRIYGTNYADESICPMLFGTNPSRDQFNNQLMRAIPGRCWEYSKECWGEQSMDWNDKQIPKSVRLKVGCMVMTLCNEYDHGMLVRANGSIGMVLELQHDHVVVQIGGREMNVFKHKEDNSEWYVEASDRGERWCKTDPTGSCEYMPLTMASGMTVHKSQGLTLPHAQIFLDDWNMNQPAMLYVAASRVKDPTKLYWSGRASIRTKCNIDPLVQAWI